MKRTIALALSLLLLIGLVPTAQAASSSSTVSTQEAATVLDALDIMVGYDDGDLHLNDNVTRAQFIKLVISASAYRDNIGTEASVSPYPDVPKSHWAAGYIQAGVSLNFINGYLDGSFRPDNTIALSEGVTMLLRLLGYTDADFTGTYPSGQMALYRALKMDAGVTASENSAPLTRYDCLYLFYNLLKTNNTSGVPHINTLGYTLNADGDIELLNIVNATMEGPIIVEGDWTSALPFALSEATVNRNGVAASYTDIVSGDVLYYSKSMKTIWVYHNQITGVFEQLVGTLAEPQGMVVAGQSYSFESSSAVYDASDLGSYRAGDLVTISLGRNGAIAAISTPSESNGIVIGITTALYNAGYTNALGEQYTKPTMSIYATDGNTYNYPYTDTHLTVGTMVQVNITSNGVEVVRLSSKSLSGYVNSSGTKVNDIPFSSDVQILDTYETTGVINVSASRLADMNLTSSNVRYYAKNSAGEITHLILKDATGDIHKYGVITENTSITAGMTSASSYIYDIAGTPGVFASESKNFGDIKGPFMLLSDAGSATGVKALSSRAITSVDDSYAYSENNRYRLSENYLVYVQISANQYYLSTWNEVKDYDYSFTAWYDKSESEGGRVRIILAKTY